MRKPYLILDEALAALQNLRTLENNGASRFICSLKAGQALQYINDYFLESHIELGWIVELDWHNQKQPEPQLEEVHNAGKPLSDEIAIYLAETVHRYSSTYSICTTKYPPEQARKVVHQWRDDSLKAIRDYRNNQPITIPDQFPTEPHASAATATA